MLPSEQLNKVSSLEIAAGLLLVWNPGWSDGSDLEMDG